MLGPSEAAVIMMGFHIKVVSFLQSVYSDNILENVIVKMRDADAGEGTCYIA